MMCEFNAYLVWSKLDPATDDSCVWYAHSLEEFVCESNLYPAVQLCYSITSGGRMHRAVARNHKLQGAESGLVLCFITEIHCTKDTHSHERIQLWVGYKCSYTAASLHLVDLKPLNWLLYSLLLLAEVVFTNYAFYRIQQHDWLIQKKIKCPIYED